ncbi:MAG TPA: hypothetical protein IAB06_00650 [Candidatus Avacidaminococcus intestinavium]|uniref:Uncharacterized protein n=1 Tax=Candidatus Avacidaminococcus intestinavium TaxID=2840684 RepID=A0A9D1MN02_9FIRM|nr:hypothetical protein [Candidatus Avacidaminococcus intestinavium]
MIKKRIMALAMLVMLSSGYNVALAAEESVEQQTLDPTATNMEIVYPLIKEVLPPLPIKPANLQDAKAVTKYIADVDEYMKMVQKYIDGTTNDLNKIIEERNKAIGNANQVINEYNEFFSANAQG